MKQRFLSLALLVCVSSFLRGQTSVFDALLENISYHADIMINTEIDQNRIKGHDLMVISLDSFLSQEGSYEISLDSITGLSVLHGENFRFVTWQLRKTNEAYSYGGFIQWHDRIVRFKDSRPFINGSSFSMYTPAGWYGCIYYKMIPFELDKRKYYVLLGFNAENSSINTKIADILDLSGDEPRLGVPVFSGNEEPRTRLIMNYADISNARMMYDTDLGAIVHDHIENLAGVGPNGEPLPVSDGSMEAWVLKKGNWVYEEKVYDIKVAEPPMTDERRNRVEEKDILGRPRKD